jgi:Ca2+/Na+ antiporter
MCQWGIVLYSESEKNKFKLYTKGVFKPLFIVFFIILTVRIILLFSMDRAESVTLSSIALGYIIITIGSLFLAVIVAVMGIYKEREEKST